ncbi:MAG: tyrosine-type recombinase/integrase [Nitrososphaerales archaeon]
MFEPAATLEASAIPRAEWRWQQEQREYVEKRARESLSKRHVQEIDRVLSQVIDRLSDAGFACQPSRFGERELDHLLNGPWRPATESEPGLSSQSRKYNVCLLNGFLKSIGNLTVENRRLRFPHAPVRPIQALTEDEARRLLVVAAPRGIVCHSIVALELLMGLRRSEVLRVRLVDIGDGVLTVHGKGREGGKKRWLPFHDEVRRILPELVAHRQQIVSGFRGPDPGYLFVHRVGDGQSKPYSIRVWSKAYVDRQFVIPAFEQARVRKAANLNHALRRTCGRTAWVHGVPIEKISYMLGHEDTRTTRRYLALNLEDVRSVIAVLNEVFPSVAAG